MEQDFKKYLAERILSDGEHVSYRSLSRHLKVHSNIAKQFLQEFYIQQRSKKPGSVHAIYLVSGTKVNVRKMDINGSGQDTMKDFCIQENSFLSSPVQRGDDPEEHVAFKVITLVTEQDLEVMRAKYQRIFSIHIYSLGPSSIQNLQILSNCNREIAEHDTRDEPLDAGKQYGTVHNARVKRRTGQSSALVEPSSTILQSKVGIRKSENTGETTSKTAEIADEKSKARAANQIEIKSDVKPKLSEKNASNKVPGLRRARPDIFKSFSKAQSNTRPSDEGRVSVLSSPPAAIARQERLSVHDDEPVMDLCESEHEEDSTEEAEVAINAAKFQEEQLRQMMNEDEDEAMVDSAVCGSQDSSPSSQIEIPREPSPEPQSVISGGRRRGKRKVMKRNTFKDEEGYLVTKDETLWESFSEDEPVTQTERTPSSSTSSAGKVKKANAKLGQGNITSFFGKK